MGAHHCCWEFTDHGHVDGDIISAFHTGALEVVGNLADHLQELGIGQGGLLTKIIALKVESDLVAKTCFDVPVQAIVGEIGLSSRKPFNLDLPFVHIEVVPA